MNWKEKAKKHLASGGKISRSLARDLGVSWSSLWSWAVRDNFNGEEVSSGKPSAHILIIDTESAPTKAYVWRRWKENISQSQVIDEGYLLSYAAKWLGEDTIIAKHIGQAETDKELVEDLHELLSKADVVIAHNNKKFDNPLMLTRMLFHGFNPPAPYRVEDTLEMAKKTFKFPSNSLDNICAYLGLEERKQSHSGFELWVKSVDRDAEALEEMLEYNIQDIVVLEQVYLKLRPWWSKHQNIAVYEADNKMRCPCCASEKLEELDKLAHTQLSSFVMYRCKDCGKHSRSRTNLRTKEQMKNTLTNVV